MPQIPKELEKQVKAHGETLLQPPSSVDELLPLLDQTEILLSKIEQSPTKTMHSALSPVMIALVSDKLLKHSDTDVKVAVASCISEITRITAPEAPYDDDKMKDIFQLMVSSFEDIADTSSRSHAKRATILETVCKVRSCVIMLDLECDQMIIEMFQHFLKAIRDHHSESIFTNMETIMSLILEESEDISLDMLKPILSTLKNNNEIASPIAKKLAERVIRGSSEKLRPYLPEALKALGSSLEDYSEVVASVCRGDNGTCAQSNDSILRAPSVVKESTEETDPHDKDRSVHRSPKSTEGNGAVIEEIVVDANTPKKADSDNASDAKVSKTESDHTDEPAELEAKVDEVAKRKERQSTSVNDSAGSSDALDSKKQSEKDPANQEHTGEEIQSLPDEVTPEAPASLDDAKDASIDPSPSEENENEDVNVTSPKKSGGLPEQSQVKRSTRTKRKGNLVKKGTASIHTVPKKVTVGEDLSGAQKQQRSGKGQPSKKASETTLIGESQLDNNDGNASGSETDSQPLTENVKVEENVSTAKKQQGSSQKQPLKKTNSALAEEGEPKSDGDNGSDSETNSLDQTEKLKVVSVEKKMAGAKKQQRSRKKQPAKRGKKKAVTGKDKPKNDGLKESDSETNSVDEKVLSDEEENVSGAKQQLSGKKLSAKKAKKDSPLIVKDESKSKGGDASDSETNSLDQMEASDEETVSGEKELQRSGKKQPPKKVKNNSTLIRSESKVEDEDASDSETKSVDDMDVSHEEISSGAKKQQQSGKKPAAKKAKKDSSLDESEDDGGSASDSDTNLLVKTGKLRDAMRKRDNASSSRKEDRKKGAVFKSKPEKDVSESSARDDGEDMVTSPRSPLKSGKDQRNHEDTPKTSNKRKRTPGTEKASGAVEYGENLVGSEVRVWWPKDKAFYVGVVDSFDSVKKKHKVLYVDGDEEILNMKREKWEFVGDSVLGKRVDHPSDDASSDMKKKHKGASSNASTKPVKMENTDKSKSKDTAAKSKGKSKEDDKIKLKSSSKPSAKSDDETAKTKDRSQRLAGKSHDDSAKLSGKSKEADTEKTPVSKHDSDKTSKSKGKTQPSVKAPGSSGSALAKSGSSKAKQTEKPKEKLVESAKSPETAKGKSQDASKSRDNDAKSVKKRRR